MTLRAARQSYPDRRIWAVWQPHTYSRTAALYQEFTAAFKDADKVIVLDVYAAREEKPEGFQIEDLVKAIDHRQIQFIPGIDQAVQYLSEELVSKDLLMVFTAGDAIKINDRIVEVLNSYAGSSKGEES